MDQGNAADRQRVQIAVAGTTYTAMREGISRESSHRYLRARRRDGRWSTNILSPGNRRKQGREEAFTFNQ